MTILLDMSHVHVPVLAGELIDALDPAPGQLAIDCTFGAGGHARLVADRVGSTGELICIDRDPEAERRHAEFAREVSCATRFVHGDYADVLPALREQGVSVGRSCDLLYMDLGISSLQIDTRERGFSYAFDAPLDMRMDPGTPLDAAKIVNEWPEQRLAAILREYGEERYARRIAREIDRTRERAPIETTTELVAVIKRAVPIPAQFGSGHPARRTFQAIRIAVNDEIGSLERALPEAWSLIATGGRMAAISFHSLEDRRVKRFFAGLARGCVCPPELPVCVCGHEPEAELITRRVVRPTEGEVANNPRARAGRLRAARKLTASSDEQGSYR
ncbi:MAG: 16S rRNA (cytosine(1402)-N(4))-methyltransferase RsmH [Solirubrobacterales bacterium]